MLFLSNNGATCKDQLCQHPECWQTNVRRVREAVKRRNGIKQERFPRAPTPPVFKQRSHLTFQENEELSLPTLKVVDVTGDLTASCEESDEEEDEGLLNKRGRPCRSAIRRKECTSLSPKVPYTTPVSPGISEVKKKPHRKKMLSSAGCKGDKANKISFHEVYDYEEVYQDWQETFVSSAYLVWCPSKKKNVKRKSRASSAVAGNKAGGFKNFIEVMLPLPPEHTKKKRRESKVPTGGQPYSPCRSPVARHDQLRTMEYFSEGEFFLTVTKENIPESLMTSKKIIENRRKARNKDQDHLGVKQSSSTKVLVDITSKISSPADHENDDVVKEGTTKEEDEKDTPGKLEDRTVNEPRRPKTAGEIPKRTSDFEPRRVLPLPSVAIPWGLIPVDRRHHCANSIPHGVDLGVIMEPVVYVPRSSSASGSKAGACAEPPLSQEVMVQEDKVNVSSDNIGERDHLTSAYRFSPRVVFAPAPTPITPRTRDGLRRQLSDLIRSNTTRSLSKTIPPGNNETDIQHEVSSSTMGSKRSARVPAGQRSNSLDDHVILEVEEINRRTYNEISKKFSRVSIEEKPKESDVQTGGVQKAEQDNDLAKANDDESTVSGRPVSPSSRTNIPPDIWAELQGEVLDDRHSPRKSNLNLRRANGGRSSTMTRRFRSSFGLSVYSYAESSWKPSSTKLPRSFLSFRTCHGPYKQTILPQMPASLTVVPVPSVTRSAHSTTYPRQYQLEKSPSIRMPPVPAGSPVPDIEITVQEDKSCKTDLAELNRSREEVGTEVEYLIARDVVSHLDLRETAVDDGTGLFGDVGSKEKLSGVGDLRSQCRVDQDEALNEETVDSRSSGFLLSDEATTADDLTKGECNEEGESNRIGNASSQEKLEDDSRYEVTDTMTNENREIDLQSQPCANDSKSQIEEREYRTTNGSQQLEIHESRENVREKAPSQDPRQGTENSGSSEQIQAEISNKSLLSNKSSDFELEPFTVESELLRPIPIESDLFLLGSDSYLDLSFDEKELDKLDA